MNGVGNPVIKRRGLARNTRGTSMIELALLSPLAAMLLMGLVDTSLGFQKKLSTEQVAQRIVEKATAYGTAGSDYSGLPKEAADEAAVPQSAVTMDKWLACDGVRQADFNGTCIDDEEISRHISIRIASAYKPMFPYGPLGKIVGAQDDGAIPFSVVSLVRIQ